MNDLDLRDIHLPEASLWWPPAPGWWLLALLLVAAAILLPLLWRRWREHSLRRASLRALQAIEQDYARHRDPAAALRDVSSLLRRTLISYRGRAGYAHTSGDAWAAQLRELSTRNAFDEQQLRLLGHERYRAEYDCDLERLLDASQRWLRALPRSDTDVAA